MSKFDIKIKALSDICVGGGENVTGAVDTEVVANKQGDPIVTGTVVKGLLNEGAQELQEFGLVSQQMIDKLFGTSGTAGGSLVFQTLQTEGHEKLHHFLKHARHDENWARYTKREKVQEYFGIVRSQTALTEEGVAMPNALRHSRVVKKGTVFCGTISSAEELSETEIELLTNCAKMTRHMGMNRTRGMGNVKVTIEKIEESTNKFVIKENLCEDEEAVLPVRITMNHPCVLEKNYISGNILKGIYIAAYRTWKPSVQLHEEELFQKLFLSNLVKFGYCWPLEETENWREKWYLPTPYTFVKRKKSNNGDVFDLAACKEKELWNELDEKEHCGEEFVNLEEDEVYTISIERTESYHHRRATDRSKGHAQESDSDANSGQLYTIDAICAGNKFYGEIHGPKYLLDILKNLLPEGKTALIGASKTAKYGEVKVSYKEYENELPIVELHNKMVITLLSPMVVRDSYGNMSTAAEDVVKEILGESVEHMRSFCKEEVVNGYNAKWNMPVPQRNVLMPGSVFVIYGKELKENEIETMNKTFYGLYQNEGYGRIAVNMHGNREKMKIREEEKEELEILSYEECGCKNYVNTCLMDMLRQFYKKEDSAEVTGKLRKTLQAAPNSNVLSGLQQICNTSTNFKELVDQLDKAIDRATKKNSNWFEQIKTKIVKKEVAVTDSQNEFYDMLKEKIRTSKLEIGYQERMKELLQENSFKLFREMFTAMIYEVHLVKGKRG